MRISTEEVLHPDRWLRQVLSEKEQFLRLLYQSAGLASAAYRLAQAQLRATGRGPAVPTLAELRLAARMIAARTGRSPELPIEAAPVESRAGRAARLPSRPEPSRASAPTPPSRRPRAAS